MTWLAKELCQFCSLIDDWRTDIAFDAVNAVNTCPALLRPGLNSDSLLMMALTLS